MSHEMWKMSMLKPRIHHWCQLQVIGALIGGCKQTRLSVHLFGDNMLHLYLLYLIMPAPVIKECDTAWASMRTILKRCIIQILTNYIYKPYAKNPCVTFPIVINFFIASGNKNSRKCYGFCWCMNLVYAK